MSQNTQTLDQTVDVSRNENVDVLLQASKVLERCLARDNTAPTLLDQFSYGPQTGPTVSGLSDHDYPSLVGLPVNLSGRTQIKTHSKVPLPLEIMEHFNHMQCHCMMGLFPEINRAWLTIDSDIYVWTYEDGGDVAYYDGLNETIVSVGLIKPRHGVFLGFIKHLLVLTTAIDIVVLAVTFADDDGGSFQQIQLVSDPVFTLATDGAMMTTIVGSLNGRLFMGSKDGCLYEITYQAEYSWFGKRCKKVNHSTSKLAFLVPSFAYAAMNEEDGVAQIVIDDTRHILYLLTEKGTIEVYDLGETGASLSRVVRVRQSSLVQQAVSAVKTLDSQNFHPIIAISPVELTESARINLVATTQSGVRLYLTATTQSQTGMASPRPTTLALLHVRLPPGLSATTHYRPRNVHMADYRDRNALMISTVNEKETLWSIGSDIFPFSGTLLEACTTIDLDGPVLAMTEVKYNVNLLLQPTQQMPPLIVRQHSEPPRKYVVLTSQGAHVLIKLRPVDLLRQLLLETHGQDSEATKAFFNLQQDEQACATALILASLESPHNADVSDFATNAFFVFGGEPRLTTAIMHQSTPFNSPSMFMPNVISTPLGFNQQPNYTNQSFTAGYLQQPQQQQQQVTFASPNVTISDMNSPFLYSAKHNGLYLYVARILRPLWNLRCVERMTLDGKKFYLTSTVSSGDCAWILCHLTSLRGFLQRTTQLSVCKALPKPPVGNSTTPQQQQQQQTRPNYTIQDAQIEERQSLDALKFFVSHSAQILGLWKVLSEHQFHVLMEKLPLGDQQVLQNTCFKDMFLYGQDLCATVINTLINSYLGDNASVDSISNKLREICPNLYKIEDAACSKANEILKAAKSVKNVNEKEELILSALNLCKSVAPNINVRDICEQFTTQKAYQAVIELCATCAKALDTENLALHFYRNGDQGDQEGYLLYSRRMEIYKQVVAMLDVVHAQYDPSQNITNVGGQNTSSSTETSNNITKQIIQNVLTYPDELLHIAVYEWMLNKQLNSELIAVTEPTLETYLVKASQHNPNNIGVMEILWKYYESNNNHAAAANVLNNLASSTNASIQLKDRISYLARSLICMRSDKMGYAPYLGVFMRDTEDKLEVAKVQEKVLDAVLALRGRHLEADEAALQLNSKLFDITQLYEDFAEKFSLWECKLAIINCAGYADQALIENIWRNILQNEVARSTAGGSDTVVHVLSKVRILMRQYKPKSACIPLGYLIKELELISAKVKADKSLVPNFFVNMEYDFETLIHKYNEAMYTSGKDNFWMSEDNEFHYSEAITSLIHAFVVVHEKFTNVEKRKIIALCQDTVASLLSNLYSKPNTEQIIAVLRNIQAKLTRM